MVKLPIMYTFSGWLHFVKKVEVKYDEPRDELQKEYEQWLQDNFAGYSTLPLGDGKCLAGRKHHQFRARLQVGGAWMAHRAKVKLDAVCKWCGKSKERIDAERRVALSREAWDSVRRVEKRNL